MELQSVLNIYDGAVTGQVSGWDSWYSHGHSLPEVTGPRSDLSSPDLRHHPRLGLGLAPRLVLDYLHQVEEGAVHVSVAHVVHLGTEPYELAWNIPSPVGGDGCVDGSRLAAQTTQSLVISALTCRN